MPIFVKNISFHEKGRVRRTVTPTNVLDFYVGPINITRLPPHGMKIADEFYERYRDRFDEAERLGLLEVIGAPQKPEPELEPESSEEPEKVEEGTEGEPEGEEEGEESEVPEEIESGETEAPEETKESEEEEPEAEAPEETKEEEPEETVEPEASEEKKSESKPAVDLEDDGVPEIGDLAREDETKEIIQPKKKGGRKKKGGK